MSRSRRLLLNAPSRRAPSPQASEAEEEYAIYPYYLERWEETPDNMIPLFFIDERYELCYRRLWTQGEHIIRRIPITREAADATTFFETFTKVYSDRVDCMLRDTQTEQVTPIISGETQPFARELENGEYGLVVDGTMFVFGRQDRALLRLEDAPPLQISDLVSEEYLVQWYSDYTLPNEGRLLGDFSERYGLHAVNLQNEWACSCASTRLGASTLICLLDREEGRYTPFTYTAGTWDSPTGGLLWDGSFALQDDHLGVLTFDPLVQLPLARYDSLRDLAESDWNPIASLPYGSGTAEIGAVRQGDDLFYGVSVGGQVYSTDAPFEEEHFFAANAPQFGIYGDILVLCAKNRYFVELSLTDGAYKAEEIQNSRLEYLFLKERSGVALRYTFNEEHSPQTLVIRLWAEGRAPASYEVELTEELAIPAYLYEMSLDDAAFDPDANSILIAHSGWEHRIDLDTLTVDSKGSFPLTPQFIYDVSDNGRYVVGSVWVGGGGDVFSEQLYIIDRETDDTWALPIVHGMYGYWGHLNIVGDKVAVFERGVRFYDLATGKRLELTLPALPEWNFPLGVAYDSATGWYLRASYYYRWDQRLWDEPQGMLPITFDYFDSSGKHLSTLTTQVSQRLGKFEIPYSIHLTSYHGKVLFLEYGKETDIPESIVSFDPLTGEVARREGNFLLASDGFLFTASYEYDTDGAISGYQLCKFQGEQLVDRQILTAELPLLIGYMEYDLSTETLAGWSTRYDMDDDSKLFTVTWGTE